MINIKKIIILSAFLLALLSVNSCVTHPLDEAGNEITNDSTDSHRLSEIYVNLAALYQEQGALASALDRANMAIKVYAGNAHAHLIRANIYAALGETAPAEKDYKKAISLDRGYYDAYVFYGSFLCSQRKYDLAQANFNKAISNPLAYNRGFGYYGKGKCLLDQKQYTSAESFLKKSLDFQDTPNLAYFYLASIAFTQDDPDTALTYLDKYNGPINADILALRIKILQQLQKANKYNASNNKSYQDQINILKKQLSTNFPGAAAQNLPQ